MFKYDPATKECMGENLMIPDPYEFNHVLVKQSRMKGGGDGLFTKARMFKGDIIAFYNGVRSLSKEIVSSSFACHLWKTCYVGLKYVQNTPWQNTFISSNLKRVFEQRKID